MITYRYGQLDTVQSRFKAVSRTGQALSIMFFGEAFDPLRRLIGEAANEFGDTFVFSGPSDADCEPSFVEAASATSTVYRRARTHPSSQ